MIGSIEAIAREVSEGIALHGGDPAIRPPRFTAGRVGKQWTRLIRVPTMTGVAASRVIREEARALVAEVRQDKPDVFVALPMPMGAYSCVLGVDVPVRAIAMYDVTSDEWVVRFDVAGYPTV